MGFSRPSVLSRTDDDQDAKTAVDNGEQQDSEESHDIGKKKKEKDDNDTQNDDSSKNTTMEGSDDKRPDSDGSSSVSTDSDNSDKEDSSTSAAQKDATQDHDMRDSVADGSRKQPTGPLVIGLVIAIGAAAFFAGAYAMSIDHRGDLITQEDLDDAVAKLELKILQGQLAGDQEQQPQPPPVRISADDDPTIGDPNAPITIIEFSDFQCPFCARFSSQTLPAIQSEYIDKGLVKLVYRDFPLQNIHPNAVVTALAAECADDQGGFKGMHDILFENQREWSGADAQEIVGILAGYASETGIDPDAFETCLVTGVHVDDIRMDLEDGRAYGVSGTPGFYIGNDEIGYVSVQGAQPFESFKRVIDAQLGT